MALFQAAWLRAQCDAHCFLGIAGSQLPGLQLSRGPGAGRLVQVTRQVGSSHSDTLTLSLGLFAHVIPRRHQAVLGIVTLPFGREDTEAETAWL